MSLALLARKWFLSFALLFDARGEGEVKGKSRAGSSLRSLKELSFQFQDLF